MNIFRNTENFITDTPLPTTENLISLFTLAKEIRTNLKQKGYLMDNYISIFFSILDKNTAYSIADDGFQSVDSYQPICIYADKNINVSTEIQLQKDKFQIDSFQEYHTRTSLLYSVMADKLIADALENFTTSHSKDFDTMRLDEIYNEISDIVGSDLMDKLNDQLKNIFLTAFPLAIFYQGFMDNLLFRLADRDIETNKQIFQLIMDKL